MKVGISQSEDRNASFAGQQAAKQALSNGSITKPSLVIAFCFGETNAEDFYQGVRTAVGPDVPIVGGQAIGVITNDLASYEGSPSAVAVLEDETLSFAVQSQSIGLGQEADCGKALAASFHAHSENELMFLLFDLVRTQANPESNIPNLIAATDLLDGLQSSLPQGIPIIGAGLIRNHDFQFSALFTGHGVASGHAVCVQTRGDFKIFCQIMHGCTPQDGIYHRLTKIKGPIVYEVDNKPVVEVLNDKFGGEKWQERTMISRLTIGVNLGDRYKFNEAHYINRLILGTLPGKEGVVIYQPDLKEGTEFQFLIRDPKTMLESAKTTTSQLVGQIKSQGLTPLFAIYVDCAGRTAQRSELLTEEAHEVRQILNAHRVPVIGFYSGCEIAPLFGKGRTLAWSGVLSVFAR
jgi:hypothetical protein